MSDRDNPIAQLQQLLQQRLGMAVSPIELQEIIYLALQRSDGISRSSAIETAKDAVDVEIRTIEADENRENRAGINPKMDVVLPSAAETARANQGAAVPVQVPDAAVLRDRRKLLRSLRPLMRKVPSRRRFTVDDEATAVQIAEKQIWEVVQQPDRERWLELAIVVEVTNVYGVWRPPIERFCADLVESGMFRDVRVWQMQADEAGQPRLYQQRSRRRRGAMANAKELLNPASDRVILVVSDCTSGAWRSGAIPELLQQWMQAHLVTLVQLLPPVYWERSALKYGVSVAMQPKQAAVRNADWRVVGLSPQRRRRLPEGLMLPVVTVEPESLDLWARTLVAQVGQATVGQVVDVDMLLEAFRAKSAQGAENNLDAAALIDRFERTATQEAIDLAEILALVPLDWAVIRLVQKNLLGQTASLFLAEMVLSGLLVAQGEGDYEFQAGVRSRLVQQMGQEDGAMLADEVAAEIIYELLPEAAQRRMEEIVESLSRDLSDRKADAPKYFEAFLVAAREDWGDAALQGRMLKFGAVGEEVLRSWGGEYVEVADRLLADEPPITVKWPEVQPFEFETVQLVRDESEDEFARAFEFETAQVAMQRQGLRRRKRLVITKSRGTVRGYAEPLRGGVELELVMVPAGRFVMGSPGNELERTSDEGPQHEVTVPKFLMGRYPVTQAQWRVVAGWAKVERSLDSDPSRFKGSNRPVEQVSWLDAIEFCARLSQRTGREYRLPSEAEWEYACRSGTNTPFYFGETITPDLANYDGNYTYGDGPKGVYREETTEVGQFPANGFGLHDMHGNVREWCMDHWHSSYDDAPTDGSAWIDKTAETTAERVLRGGSWLGIPRNCRSAQRVYLVASTATAYFGFRVVCVPPGLF
jgi:formylglycine-generating enzyme required for sulfatase activity